MTRGDEKHGYPELEINLDAALADALSTHFEGLPAHSPVFVDFYFFSQVGQCMEILLDPSQGHCFFESEDLKRAVKKKYKSVEEIDFSFWNTLSMRIVEHFLEPTPALRSSRQIFVEHTQKLLLCLLMSPAQPTPQQLIPHSHDPRHQAEAAQAFLKKYWTPFARNNPNLVHRVHDLILYHLFQAETPGLRVGPPGCVELIKDGRLEAISALSTLPVSDELVQYLADLAVLTNNTHPLAHIKAVLNASFRNGCPCDTIDRYMNRATLWTKYLSDDDAKKFQNEDTRRMLACRLWMAVLNDICDESSPSLRNIQAAMYAKVRNLKEKNPTQIVFVIDESADLRRLFKALRARVKEYFFTRYRNIARGSALSLAGLGAVSLYMATRFALTGDTLFSLIHTERHAANWDLIFSSTILSLSAASTYVGIHAIGSVDETALLRQIEASLDVDSSRCARGCVHNVWAFSASLILTLATLLISSQDLIFEWEGADVNSMFELYFPLVVFMLAALAEIAEGPWAVQLLYDRLTRPALPALTFGARSTNRTPLQAQPLLRHDTVRQGTMLYGEAQNVLELMAALVPEAPEAPEAKESSTPAFGLRHLSLDMSAIAGASKD